MNAKPAAAYKLAVKNTWLLSVEIPDKIVSFRLLKLCNSKPIANALAKVSGTIWFTLPAAGAGRYPTLNPWFNACATL